MCSRGIVCSIFISVLIGLAPAASQTPATVVMIAGNGQVVQTNFPAIVPFTIEVLDAARNPVPNVPVSWALSCAADDYGCTTQFPGTLFQPASQTDVNGMATSGYNQTYVPPGLSYTQATVTASTSVGSVVFKITASASLSSGTPALSAYLSKPIANTTITAQGGTVVPSAVQISVSAISGFSEGQPIAHVGVQIIDALTRLASPVAYCNGIADTVLTDTNGNASCDLVVSNMPGMYRLAVDVGGGQAAPEFVLQITSGSSCTYSISPMSQAFPAAGGGGLVNVTAPTGCQWTATTNPGSFVTVTSGASGTGTGIVGYTVGTNTGAPRSGTISIASQTFTANQGGTSGGASSLFFTSVLHGQSPATQIITLNGNASGTGATPSPSGCGTAWLTAAVNGNSVIVGVISSNLIVAGPTMCLGSISITVPGSPTVTTGVTVEVVAAPLDFTAIGRSGALLYDPSMGQEYTALSNGNGTYQYSPNLFTSGFDTLRTGDYNGDGKTDLIVYNSHTSLAYIGMGSGDGTFNFQSLFWSPGYDMVTAGDINGDGRTDLALYNSSTGTLYTAISNGTGGFTYLYHLVTSGFTFVRLADFTGDGKADLFLYNSNNGLAFLGVGDGGGGFAFHALSMSSGYTLADIGDLNRDGKADIIVYNPANGNAATGISDGFGGLTFTPLLFSPGFTAVRLADYTGDGFADLAIYNENTASAYFGTGDGTGNFVFQSMFWSPGYDSVIAGDVNGDGRSDVILYNSATGTEYTGISNGNGTFTYVYSLWGPGKLLAK